MTLDATTPSSASSTSSCTSSSTALNLLNTNSLSPPTTSYDYSADFGDDLFLDDLIGSDDSSDLDLPPFPLGNESNATAIRSKGLQPASYSSNTQHSSNRNSSSAIEVHNALLPPPARKRLFTSIEEGRVQNSTKKGPNHFDFCQSPPAKKHVFRSSIKPSAMNCSSPLPSAKRFPPDCIPLSRKLSSQLQQHMTSPSTDRALSLLQPDTTSKGSNYKHVPDAYASTRESRTVPELLKSKAHHVYGPETHATSSTSQPKPAVLVSGSSTLPTPAAGGSSQTFKRNAARLVCNSYHC